MMYKVGIVDDTDELLDDYKVRLKREAIELIVAPPIPTKVEKAIIRFIKGKVIANPDMANGPTPCPIKTLSIILYNDVTVIPIIAGIEYCNNNLPTDFVSNTCDAFKLDITPDPPFKKYDTSCLNSQD